MIRKAPYTANQIDDEERERYVLMGVNWAERFPYSCGFSEQNLWSLKEDEEICHLQLSWNGIQNAYCRGDRHFAGSAE